MPFICKCQKIYKVKKYIIYKVNVKKDNNQGTPGGNWKSNKKWNDDKTVQRKQI